MAALTMYDKVIKMLEQYDGKLLWTAKIKNLMRRNIGGNEQKTIVPYLKMMREMGIIKEISLNKWRVKLPNEI